MKVLIVGSGGREHALAWKIAQSPLAKKVFCAPGNGGIAGVAECVPIKAEDIGQLLDFARREKIGLTVVGPEAPLAAGIVDEFRTQGLAVFGPEKKAARLEASKVFSKELMARHKVPTASFEVFDSYDAAASYVEKNGAPCVIKADGLAAGKGVVVAQSVDEAKQALSLMMKDKAFGAAADKVIIEECLAGQEASILVLTDSREVVALATSQDHKRIFDQDQGPNTGGMGAYSPAPVVSPALFDEIIEKIVCRTIDGLAKEGIPYQGILYAGVMLTKDGPKTLEFNVRFGDPETEAILPRLDCDLLEAMLAVSNSQLAKYKKAGGLRWKPSACVSVVCSSRGYPGSYETGKVISGLADAAAMKDVAVFHAGTKRVGGDIVTSGGRVLAVSGLGATIKEASARTYQAVGKINFEGMHYRRDIGARAL